MSDSNNWVLDSIRTAPYETASLVGSHAATLGFGVALGVAVFRTPVVDACTGQALPAVASTCGDLATLSNQLLYAGTATLAAGILLAVVADVLEEESGSLRERLGAVGGRAVRFLEGVSGDES